MQRAKNLWNVVEYVALLYKMLFLLQPPTVSGGGIVFPDVRPAVRLFSVGLLSV